MSQKTGAFNNDRGESAYKHAIPIYLTSCSTRPFDLSLAPTPFARSCGRHDNDTTEDERTYADDSTSPFLLPQLEISSGYAFVEFEDERDAEE